MGIELAGRRDKRYVICGPGYVWFVETLDEDVGIRRRLDNEATLYIRADVVQAAFTAYVEADDTVESARAINRLAGILDVSLRESGE